jgi:purine-nucleoside phosphorylase
MSDSFFTFRDAVLAQPPIAAIVLGSGLNQVADSLPLRCSVEFFQIPGMPNTGVAGHRGRLGLHEFGGARVLVFQGRTHFYEGHPWPVVEFPVRIAHELGARMLILTNASGGIGPDQIAGTLMAIRDQISAATPHWWRNRGRGCLGGPLASPYSEALVESMRVAAAKTGVYLSEGIYAGVTGPNYETPAEIRALRVLGADAVGMSTVCEASAAARLGMTVAGISCVANRAAGLSQVPLSHAEVLSMVAGAARNVSKLILELLRIL